MKVKEYKDFVMELTGLEGTGFERLRVNRFGFDKKLQKFHPSIKEKEKFYITM